MEIDSNLFVGLKNKDELRRNILEASKSTVLSLQSHQRVKDIQKEISSLKKDLKEHIKEIKMLLTRIQRSFPKDLLSAKNTLPKLPELKDAKDFDNLNSDITNLEKKLEKF